MKNVLSFLARLSLAVLVTTGAARADLMSTRPSEETIRAATAACRKAGVAPPRNITGLSDPNTLDPKVIDLIAEARAPWVRAEFHWSQIQPNGTGSYRWGKYDRMVDGFNARGIQIAGILTYIPPALDDWAVIDTRFTAFAEATVARYAARGVHVWEVFNEPNLTDYGWLTEAQAPADFLGAYTLLLARANAAVRAKDPSGIVVIGGLAGHTSRAITPEAAMAEIYRLGGKDCFDVMAFHPYGYQARFPEARDRIDTILNGQGDGGKPVWFNEYGWTDYRAMDLSVNDSEGTNPMIKAFSQRGSAEALFWFSAKDFSQRIGAPTFGLADYDYNKRASFETFQIIMDAVSK